MEGKFEKLIEEFKEEAIKEFGYKVLSNEGLHNWQIEIVNGDEGFCDKEKKRILFGKEALDNYELMLHEITHCKTDNHHYSDKFVPLNNQPL